MSDYGLKAGDKIQSPGGGVHDVLEVEGRFSLVKNVWGEALPLVCDDGAWTLEIGGDPWTVLRPRWRAERYGEHLVIYDGDRSEADYGIMVYPDDIDADAGEIVEAIVDLLNERFPA